MVSHCNQRLNSNFQRRCRENWLFQRREKTEKLAVASFFRLGQFFQRRGKTEKLAVAGFFRLGQFFRLWRQFSLQMIKMQKMHKIFVKCTQIFPAAALDIIFSLFGGF